MASALHYPTVRNVETFKILNQKAAMIQTMGEYRLPRQNLNDSQFPLNGKLEIDNQGIDNVDLPNPCLYEVHDRYVARIEKLLASQPREGTVLPGLLQVNVPLTSSCCFGGLSKISGRRIEARIENAVREIQDDGLRNTLRAIFYDYREALELAFLSNWRHSTSRSVHGRLTVAIQRIDSHVLVENLNRKSDMEVLPISIINPIQIGGKRARNLDETMLIQIESNNKKPADFLGGSSPTVGKTFQYTKLEAQINRNSPCYRDVEVYERSVNLSENPIPSLERADCELGHEVAETLGIRSAAQVSEKGSGSGTEGSESSYIFKLIPAERLELIDQERLTRLMSTKPKSAPSEYRFQKLGGIQKNRTSQVGREMKSQALSGETKKTLWKAVISYLSKHQIRDTDFFWVNRDLQEKRINEMVPAFAPLILMLRWIENARRPTQK